MPVIVEELLRFVVWRVHHCQKSSPVVAKYFRRRREVAVVIFCTPIFIYIKKNDVGLVV